MNDSTQSPSLETWFPSLENRFVAQCYRARQPHVEHGPLQRFGLRPEQYEDVPALVRAAQRTYPITAYSPGPDGLSRPLNMGVEQAIEAWQEGATISVESGVVDGDCELGRALWDALGCFRALASKNPATLFSAAGAVVPAHFDRIDAFVLVVRGAKEWTIAPNEIEHPMTSHFEGGHDPRGGRDAPSPLPPHLEGTALKMPSQGLRRFTMRSGSVAFVPSGWWHTTRALEPTISYTFRGWLVPLAELVADAIRRHLERLPRWREPPLMLGNEGHRSGALAQIEAALGHLSHDIRDLEPAAVVAQGCGAEYRRGPRGYSVVCDPPRMEWSDASGRTASVPVSDEVARVLRWARTRASFFDADLRQRFPTETGARQSARELLVRHGLFEERYAHGTALRVMDPDDEPTPDR